MHFYNKYQDALYPISKAFFQAYRVSGMVQMSFEVRNMADSDGNSVVDVYLSPRDPQSATTLWCADGHAHHMQFLETMVPADVLGYRFIMRITPVCSDDVETEVLEALAPVMG